MILDPNWFYSSIAQCAAAIIGLLGAILATRLQTQIAEAESVFRKLNSTFLQLENAIKHAIIELEREYQLGEQNIDLITLKEYRKVKKYDDV